MKKLILILLAVSVSALSARAAIRPSFALEYSAWRASDIVLVSEGETLDGELQILEVWKGDLKAGQPLSMPALAKFAPAEARRVSENRWSEPDDTSPVINGSKMVLFLKRPAGKYGAWQPASLGGDLNTAVVWWEADRLYGFVQVMNPGPSLLAALGPAPAVWKRRLDEVVRRQVALSAAIAIENPARRAWRLGAFANSQSYDARQAAYAELRKSGSAALPVLRALIERGETEKPPSSNGTVLSLLRAPDDAITTLAQVGGASVGPELTDMLRDETRFWKRTAPTLKVGWWNSQSIESARLESLRNRYSKLLTVVRALQITDYRGSSDDLVALRDFWRTLPQLEDSSGLSQMSEACNDALKSLSAAK